MRPPAAESLLRRFLAFETRIANVEFLLGYEGNAFAAVGDPEENLLGITAVHPMREEAVAAFLEKAQAPWRLVERIIEGGSLQRVEYAGHRYYLGRSGSR